ncbi:PDZ domain-containing protein [Peribacillus saganii]|uniref:PDZ domain-containing protein n=1 Tax=Peribacillus saganii TaxID=2303992 RepID=A0A372LNT7_9BACI|nr:PDZ domain-containing protein [Peribacillus saganii]RFU69360.1 PDZ domain-containing protein [Peribacillus saganii]
MAQQWLFHGLVGLGKFFVHPIFYYSIFLCLVMGYLRVKRERQDFHIRTYDGYQELRFLLPGGLFIGLVLSLLILGAGLVIPFAALLASAAITVLLSLTLKVRLLSPAYVIGGTFFLLTFLEGRDISIPFFQGALDELDQAIYPSVAILLGLLLITEGLLISRNGYVRTSPALMRSKRGLTVGAHISKRLWLVPAFILVPGGHLPAPAEWWPVFTLGEMHVTPLMVPFLIGFSQRVHGQLPKESIQLNGRRVLWLGLLITACAIIGHWYPIASIAAVSAALIGREVLHYYQKLSEDRLPFYFSRRQHGVMILGIIPKSPAYKMALQIGEIITKVNGVYIRDEKELYEALQKNAAHCKLEVLDTNGQIRFVQRALFEGEHHELGVLLIQDPRRWDVEAG